ncbi:HPr family phosphocarrier protein [Atopobium sp. oral taxon 810]|uniref:HPr family phosphocarrier protein n=1 Tax=Atopobium sp. oral taxon 810 TaxID=712158 RepID=UPI000395F1B4|nr:HPr family phosphocarrier protein [Atopobium sp. oral taxon 810]ERI06011.1 phosphocarrier, HPr family [Atopobium sp. oral taxon 810 str. F0209]
MITMHVSCGIPGGLHARPAAEFTALAQQFQSDVYLRNASVSGKFCNAKRPTQLLAADVWQNQLVELEVDGPDEEECARVLKQYLIGR